MSSKTSVTLGNMDSNAFFTDAKGIAHAINDEQREIPVGAIIPMYLLFATAEKAMHSRA